MICAADILLVPRFLNRIFVYGILLEYHGNFINLLGFKFRKFFHLKHEYPFNFGVYSGDGAANTFKVIQRYLFRLYIMIRLYVFPKHMIDFILLQCTVQHSFILIIENNRKKLLYMCTHVSPENNSITFYPVFKCCEMLKIPVF